MKASIAFGPVFAAIATGVLLGACGGGLYDAEGVPVLETGGSSCDAGQILCGGTCTVESETHCGASCLDCTTGTPPAGARAACLREGATAACGFECTGGLLKCGAGCCGAKALAAGDRHTCALLEGGQVSCWGANEKGQVGGDAEARPAPVAVPLGAGATAVAAGAAHSCAVTTAGAVRCWGANQAGQVTGTPAVAQVLAPAATPVSADAVAVAAGVGHTCALLSSGAVRCWGGDAAGQLGPGPGQPIAAGEATTALAAGRDHTCAIVSGAVRCWGAAAKGQLGATPSAGIATPPVSGIQLLAAGGDQTCAAKGTSSGGLVDDYLRCWGDSFGAEWLMAAPSFAPEIPRRNVDRATVEAAVELLAVGPRFACIRSKTEAVECLGVNDVGQLGGVLLEPARTVTVPLVSVPVPVATALAAGGAHACAVLADAEPADGGPIRCWGSNAAGQLGDGTLADPGVGTLATPLGL